MNSELNVIRPIRAWAVYEHYNEFSWLPEWGGVDSWIAPNVGHAEGLPDHVWLSEWSLVDAVGYWNLGRIDEMTILFNTGHVGWLRVVNSVDADDELRWNWSVDDSQSFGFDYCDDQNAVAVVLESMIRYIKREEQAS